MFSQTRRLLCPALLGGLLAACTIAACDAPPAPQDDQAKVVASAADPTPGASAQAAAAPTFDACLAGCDERRLSADDRATCRLRCNQNEAVDRRAIGAAPAGDSPHRPIVDAFRACNQPCLAAVDPAAQSACTDRCAGEAARPQPCASACLSALNASDLACAPKGPDDAATCRLRSATEAQLCLGKC